MEGGGCNERSSAPLLPRLDRLDVLMNYVEKKSNLPRRNNHMTSPFERRCIPLDVALSEARSRGSLLDRVALLEHRLIQLTLEMESNSDSSCSTLYTCQSSSTNRQHADDDFHRFDGRSIDHLSDNQHQVNGEQRVKSSVKKNYPLDARESLLTTSKSKTKNKSRKSCRCKRLLGC
ncbi:uncharacterized protein LOC109835945 isoform X2 [Asparagus officinalis]|nr:uncharacterized protein LOC109835945 isoform X2 [Asparagus officinalis]